MANPPPAATAFQEEVTRVMEAIKLVGPAEVSPVRKAAAIAPANWTACLRARSGDAPPYALFFNGNALVDYRVAVLIDDCGYQSYAPFTPVVLKKPPPKGAIPAPGASNPPR